MEFNLEYFFFDLPIYTPLIIEDTNSDDFNSLFYSKDRRIEGYNPWRKNQSTFYISKTLTYDDTNAKSKEIFGTIELGCLRYNDLFRFYTLWDPKGKRLVKIGQFPSVADFHINEIKQYNKLLTNEKLKEFTKAIGLAANGVGIGSFVYMRRIFEYLILEAYNKAKNDNVLSELEFQRARMDEKIDLLHSYLPSFLIENKGLYSILSLGIHELSEEDCLTHFDTIRVGIEIILDEKLDEIRKNEKIEEAKKKLNKLKSEIKK